jgi:hypothetical protein
VADPKHDHRAKNAERNVEQQTLPRAIEDVASGESRNQSQTIQARTDI